ncbi:MAG: tRNA (N6-isopentenyl adenosine(37)-C2)-methylthiotransferase MiaB, partial [Patescibacteria group bacterium]
YHIITIGCQMNKSDSERVASYLEQKNYTPVSDVQEADIAVINTCGVRQSAEDRVYGLVAKIKKSANDPKIILTGCLSKREDVKQRLKDKVDIWLPIEELPALKEKLEQENKEKKTERGEYLKIKPKLTSSFRVFIPIGNGCDNFCTYCVVPYARGREVYRPAPEILEEVKKWIDKGYKEIYLIAQNVNSYIWRPLSLAEAKRYFPFLKDQVVDFADLLKVIADMDGDFWIRFATSHPKDMSDKLIKTISEQKKICRHIHLPAQAGDSEVLQKMNRNYTVGHYKNLIKKIREYMPEGSLTTDIIVGFPGETRKQFENTKQLFREVQFDMAYVAQYSPRPETVAEKMEDNVPAEEKRRREEELMEILRETAYKNNEKHLNRTVKVLIEGKNKKGEWYGKTDTNKNVQIISCKNKELEAGRFVEVVIKDIQDFGLKGNLL